jgi:hypothetical protein
VIPGVHTIMGFAGSLVAPWLFGLALDVGDRSISAYLAWYLVLAASSTGGRDPGKWPLLRPLVPLPLKQFLLSSDPV